MTAAGSRSHFFRRSCLGLWLLQSVLLGQTPARSTLTVNGGTAQVNEPPVPPDRFELVTADAQPIENAAQRAEIVKLVNSARNHSNVRAQAYDLKTAFNALGNGSSDGAWQLQDTSPGRGLYRWTAQGPGYSVVNLFVNKMLYSDHPADSMPLRLAQVRAAIFFTQPGLGARASIRKSAGTLDGEELVCVLVMQNMQGGSVSGGRSWDEAEYCIDEKGNHLVTYSPIPGLYIHYDYAKAIAFHNIIVPAKFVITQAGQTVIEAQTVSITDPPADLSSFQPSGLSTIGMGPAMSPPWHYHTTLPYTGGATSDVPQMVVLHGMQSPKGRLTDPEILVSSDPSLNNSALQYAAKWKAGPMAAVVEPGVTPQSHEVFLTLRYVSSQRGKPVGSSNQ